MGGLIAWIRRLAAQICDLLSKFLSPRCAISWRPNALAPVFYGFQDVGSAEGAPATARVFFPSLEGSPDGAPILQDCGRYPLIVFAHGHCTGDSDHHLRWFEIPANLARAGYVVAVPALPEIAGGTSPSNADADLARLRDLVSWMRTGWVHGSLVAPAPATGLVGHSFGAGLAGRLATEGSIGAYAALSGHVARQVREAIGAPKLFTWGFPTSDGLEFLIPISDADWADLGTPKHRVVLSELAHWDYLRAGVVPCETARGTCPPARIVVWDLLTMFFGNYLPPPWVPTLPSRIPASLIPPELDLTPEQQFFAGGWLSGFGLLEGEADSCSVTISFQTSSGSGSVTRP